MELQGCWRCAPDDTDPAGLDAIGAAGRRQLASSGWEEGMDEDKGTSTPVEDEPQEAKNAREATRIRWEECIRLRVTDPNEASKHWNAWAEPLEAKLQGFRKRGEVRDPNTSTESPNEWILSHSNDATGPLSELSKLLFESRADFKGMTFDGQATNFSNFIFPGEADFRNATFDGKVTFQGAQFHGPARFGKAKFKGDVYFGAGENKTAFYDDAGFSGSKFTAENGEYVNFDGVEFKNLARFRSVQFAGVTFFGNCSFRGLFWAPQADFQNYTNFTRAKFHGFAVFGAIKSDRAFSLNEVEFKHVPDFIEADFRQAPVLDTVVFDDIENPRKTEWDLLERSFNRDNAFRDWMRDRNRSAMWRNLRRIAMQGLDNDSEQKFLAAEIRTRRIEHVKADIEEYNRLRNTLTARRVSEKGKTQTKADEIKKDEIMKEGELRLRDCVADRPRDARYILGKAFGLFSDFGRSVFRPVASLMIVCVLAWTCYVGMHLRVRSGAMNMEPVSYGGLIAFYDSLACLPGPKATQRPSDSINEPALRQGPDPPPSFNPARNGPLLEALYFTVGKGLIFSTDPQDRVPQAQACLFGRFDTASASGPLVADRALVPNSPFWVNVVAAIQTLLCTAFLFLLGLALRNKFKMR